MRIRDFVITAAVVLGLSAPALAQQASAQAQTLANPAGTSSGETHSWVVTGFLGTNFGSSRTNGNLDLPDINRFDSGSSPSFGGQLAYLGKGIVGGEFLTEFSPRVRDFNSILFERQPNVNTYMINAITAAPIGHLGSFNPYVSGGVGWVAMHADIFTINPLTVQPVDGVQDTSALGSQSVSGSRFGWDLGGGLMAWSEKNWGFRGDVRYYRAVSNSTDVLDPNNIDGATFTQVELSGFSFWKANVGLGFRF
jgi:opacity protein-like surface antigen